jgi:hypothetical protein
MIADFLGDYHIYFQNSTTMARFWFFNKARRKEVFNMLKNISNGNVLSKKDKIQYRINFKDSRHGEECFLA